MEFSIQEIKRRAGSKSPASSKPYVHVTNKMRKVLIQRVINQAEPIIKVAKELNINYSTAKAIVKVYKESGRADKIPHKKRNRHQLAENLPLESISAQESSENTPQTNVRRSTRPCKKQVKYSESDDEVDFFYEEKESISYKVTSSQKAKKTCRIRFLEIKQKEVENTPSECNLKLSTSEFERNSDQAIGPKVEEMDVKSENIEGSVVSKKLLESICPPTFKNVSSFTDPIVFMNSLRYTALMMQHSNLQSLLALSHLGREVLSRR